MAIAGFAQAVQQLLVDKSERERIRGLRDRFEMQLLEKIPAAEINGRRAQRSGHISNVSFPGISGETMLMKLDMQGIAVSTGSACSSGSARPSHVLTAMGLNEELVNGGVRFSFGRFNTEAEIDKAVEAIVSIYSEKQAG